MKDVKPKVKVSKSGRRRLDVTDLIARLEEGLDMRRAQLEKETLLNLHHKRRLSLLTAVACASSVLNQVLTSDNVEAALSEAQHHLNTLEAEARALARMLQPQAPPPAPPPPTSAGSSGDRGGRGGSGSGDAAPGTASGGSGASGALLSGNSVRDEKDIGGGSVVSVGASSHGQESEEGRSGSKLGQGDLQARSRRTQPQQQQQQPNRAQQSHEAPDQRSGKHQGAPCTSNQMQQPLEPSYALGMTPTELIRAIAQLKGFPASEDDFAEEWVNHTRKLAILLHQSARGAPVQEKVLETLCTMGVRFSALLLYHPDVSFALVSRDLETGVIGEPHRDIGMRAANAMALSQEQVAAFSVLHEFWFATSASMQKERQELAQKALQGPEDLDLQAATLHSLECVQRSHVTMAAAVKVLLLTVLLTTQQSAECYVQFFPYLPTLLCFLDSIQKVHEDSGRGAEGESS